MIPKRVRNLSAPFTDTQREGLVKMHTERAEKIRDLRGEMWIIEQKIQQDEVAKKQGKKHA